MKKTYALVCLLLAGAFTAPARAADLPWLHSEQEAMTQAQVTGKPLWLYLHADYCVWCRVLPQTTFGDSRVRLLAGAYVLCKLNGEKEGKPNIGKYHVQKYPYQAVLDDTGKLIAAAPDYMDADKYAHTFAADLPTAALARLEADHKAHSADAHLLALLAALYAERHQTEDAARLLVPLASASPAPADLTGVYHALGLADTLSGDDRAAVPLLQKAITSADDPREIVALHFLLASAFQRLEKPAEALAELETIRHYGPATKDEKKDAQTQEDSLRQAE